MIFDESIPLGPKVQSPITVAKRPLISVMIPVTNVTDELAQTLKSVISDEVGPDVMQIAVVDNATGVSRRVALNEQFQSRVECYEQQEQVSATRNLNACLDRARGEWVHILSANDVVQSNFYSSVRTAISENEYIGAFSCRYAGVDNGGVWMGLSELHSSRAGVLSDEFVAHQIAGQRLHLSCLVVRRDFYEEQGGFQEMFQYCADWDMCNRLALTNRIYYDPRFLVCVREYDRGRHVRSVPNGENIAEERRCLRMYTELFPEEWERRLRRMGMQHAGANALRRALRYRAEGNRQAAQRQLSEAVKCGLDVGRVCIEGNSLVRLLGRLVQASRPMNIRNP